MFSSKMDHFFDLYVDNHTVILSKYLLKFEVSRVVGKAVCTRNVYPNFLMKFLFVIPEPLYHLLDYPNLHEKNNWNHDNSTS